MASFLNITLRILKKPGILLAITAVSIFYIHMFKIFYSANHEVYNEDTMTGTINYKVQMMKSLAQNSTIINAIAELKAGYKKLSENKLHSGFTNMVSYSNLKDQQYQLNDFFNAINKYHPFFEAYAKSLKFKEIILIEPKDQIILYTTNLNHIILTAPKSVLLNKMLYKIISAKETRGPIISTIPGKHQQIICVPIYHYNELAGILTSVCE